MILLSLAKILFIVILGILGITFIFRSIIAIRDHLADRRMVKQYQNRFKNCPKASYIKHKKESKNASEEK